MQSPSTRDGSTRFRQLGFRSLITAAALLLLVRNTEAQAAEPTEPIPTLNPLWIALFAGAVAVLIALWLGYRRRKAGRARREPRAAAPAREGRAPGASGSGDHVHTVFISYRRSDTADVTGRIYDRLVQRFGGEHVFKDVDTVPLGVDFREHLGELVGRCDALIAVIGREWLSAAGEHGRRLDDPRDLVRVEIVAALERGIPVIPVLVGGATIPPESELPDNLRDLAYRNGIPVRPDPDFHKDLDRLIAGLESHFRR